MTLRTPEPSEFWVPEYQISGRPWTTSSIATTSSANDHNFHFVTREFTIMNSGPERIQVAFHTLGFTSGSYFEIDSGVESGPHAVRVTRLLVRASGSTQAQYSILASLTGISERNFQQPTGSGVG